MIEEDAAVLERRDVSYHEDDSIVSRNDSPMSNHGSNHGGDVVDEKMLSPSSPPNPNDNSTISDSDAATMSPSVGGDTPPRTVVTIERQQSANSGSSPMYCKFATYSLHQTSNRSRAECEMQTESTVADGGGFIDPKYEFSQWKLRRRALRIADLRNKATHSSQTEKSHFRRESETQVYVPKNQTTQTAKDNGQNPIKKLRYIKGLRGDPNSQMTVVNMELEIDGTKLK